MRVEIQDGHGGLGLSSKVANEVDIRTVRQLAKKMTREKSLMSRRNHKISSGNDIEKS